jgi:hypothetical protein
MSINEDAVLPQAQKGFIRVKSTLTKTGSFKPSLTADLLKHTFSTAKWRF